MYITKKCNIGNLSLQYELKSLSKNSAWLTVWHLIEYPVDLLILLELYLKGS